MKDKTLYILGLDCSSYHIHGVVLDQFGKLQSLFKVVSSKKDMDDRFIELTREFEEQLGTLNYAPLIAVIESAIYINNLKSTVSIAQVVAGAKLGLAQHKLDFYPIDNRVWKKYVLGSGKASKEQIMKFARQKWGAEHFSEQDYADAVCLAAWGVQRFGKEIT